MRRIISVLVRVDAVIQRRFDSVCFFLMRRFGIRKSMIRYVLTAIVTIGFALAIFQTALATGDHVVFAFIGLCCMISLLMHQHSVFKDDEAAERDPSAVSAADASPSNSPKLWMLAVLATSLLMGIGWIPLVVLPTFSNVSPHNAPKIAAGWSVFALAVIALEYLRRTPMNPPAEKAREYANTSQIAPAQT